MCAKPFEIAAAHLRRRKGAGTYCSRSCANEGARVGVVDGANDGIRAAYAAGYRATETGDICSPSGSGVPAFPHVRTGYLSFSAKGCRTPLAVHRFIAFQLFGEEALLAECVRHLNEDRRDNSFRNIVFGSREDNAADIPGPKRSLMGQRRNRARRRFADDRVREIRARLARGESVNRLRKEFGCSLGAIANIRDGRTYQDVVDAVVGGGA